MTKAADSFRPTMFDGKTQRQIWQPGDGNGDANVDILETAQARNNTRGHPTWRIFNGTVGAFIRGVKEPPLRCYLDDKAAFNIIRSNAYTNVEKHRYWPFDFAVNGLMRSGRKNRGRPAYEPGSQNVIASTDGQKRTGPYYFYGAAGPPTADPSQPSPTPAGLRTAVEAQGPPASSSPTSEHETPTIMKSVEADPPQAAAKAASRKPNQTRYQASPIPATSPCTDKVLRNPQNEGPRVAYASSSGATTGEHGQQLNLGNFMGTLKPAKRPASTVPRQVTRPSIPVSSVSSPGGILPENVPPLPGHSGSKVPIKRLVRANALSDSEFVKPAKRPLRTSPGQSVKRLRKNVQLSPSPSAVPKTAMQRVDSAASQVEPSKATFNSLKDQITRLQEELGDNKVQCDTRIVEFGKIYRQLERLEQAQKNDQADLAAVRMDLSAVEQERNDFMVERAHLEARLDITQQEVLRLKQDNEALRDPAASPFKEIKKSSKVSQPEDQQLQKEIATYRRVTANLCAALADAKAGLMERRTALTTLKKAVDAVGVSVAEEIKEDQGMHKRAREALGKARDVFDDADMAAEWEELVGEVMKH